MCIMSKFFSFLKLAAAAISLLYCFIIPLAKSARIHQLVGGGGGNESNDCQLSARVYNAQHCNFRKKLTIGMCLYVLLYFAI